MFNEPTLNHNDEMLTLLAKQSGAKDLEIARLRATIAVLEQVIELNADALGVDIVDGQVVARSEADAHVVHERA